MTCKQKVFITRRIPENGITLLKKHFEVEIYQGPGPIPRSLLLKKIKTCNAIVTLLTEKIDKEIIDAGKNLKIIANYAVGFDNIDISHANSKGIIVTNTPGVLENAVAEHTFALLFCLGRKIIEANTFVREGKYQYWDPMLLLGTQFSGKTLGLIGLGRIGEAVAIRAKGIGMNVIYNDVIRHTAFEKESGIKFTTQLSLLKTSDFISLHVPLLKSTHHLISTKELAQMKQTCILINTARGPVIDEKALISALKSKTIAGAALDVYEFEPKVSAPLLKIPNVILTPHIASGTLEAREMMAEIAARNILNVLNHKKAISEVK